MNSFPIGPLVDLTNCFVTGISACWLWLAYVRHNPKNIFLKLFAEAYCIIAIGYIFFSLPILFIPQQTEFLGIAFVLGHFALLSGAARIASLVISLHVPEKPQLARHLFLIFTMVNMLVALVPLYYVNYAQLDLHTGLSQWIIQPPVGVVLFSVLTFYLFIIMIFFGKEALAKINSAFIRRRSLFLALGAVLHFIGAIWYYSATDPWQALTANLWIVLGFLCGFSGVMLDHHLFYEKEYKKI